MSATRWQVLQWVARMVKYATLAGLSDRFGFGYVTPPPVDAEDSEQNTQQRVRFMQWFGFRSVVVVQGAEAIVVAPRGGATNAVALAADNLGFGPTDLKEGEVAVYDQAGSVIRLSRDGSLKITSHSGAAIELDANGNGVIVPKSGARLKLGDSIDANLEKVCLYDQLRAAFDSHSHDAGTLVANTMTGAVTGATGAPVLGLPSSIGSANVYAKK